MVVRLSPVHKAWVLVQNYWFQGGAVSGALSILFLTGAIDSVFQYFFTFVTFIAAIFLLRKGSKELLNYKRILTDCTLIYAELWKNEKTEFSREGGSIGLGTGSIGGRNDDRPYHQLTYLYVVDDKPYFEYYTTSNPPTEKTYELLVYSNKNPAACLILFKLPATVYNLIVSTARANGINLRPGSS